jgi:hypothetical protein
MVAESWLGRWQGVRRLVVFGCMALTGVGCGGSSQSDDDDNGGASPNDGGTGGSGKGGASNRGGSSGKAGRGGATGTGGSGGTGGASTGGVGTGGDATGATGGDLVAGTGGSVVNSPLTMLRPGGVDKVDVLLMIDNSPSMLVKQRLLAEAVPLLAERLIAPQCVDAGGDPTGEQADDSGHCASGAPEFKPIRDLHIGIITSSIGDHGSGDVCSATQATLDVQQGEAPPQYDDLAQLLPTVRAGDHLPSWDNSGFLVWDPRDQTQVDDPHPNLGETETDRDAFVGAVQQQANGVGEHGCGYEASLEAWYRFLVDPEPVLSLTHDAATSLTVRGPVNQVVLAQRERFLRRDSALVILMMTDENDCSIIDEDGAQGWVVPYKGGASSSALWHMPRATSVCATNPNDTCCGPCSSAVKSGCPTTDTDPECAKGNQLSSNEDPMDLRCFAQVKRFGVDLLYPVSRYVEAIKNSAVTPRLGRAMVPNPLFASGPNGELGRDRSLVFLAGILGVPWQDVSTADSWRGRELTYLRSFDLAADGRWDIMLGDPSQNRLPTDTLMIESIDPRTSYPPTHPLTGDTIAPSDSATRTNPINGHEHSVGATRGDLQYACIFELPEPVACDDENARGCDCNAEEYVANHPLCEGGSVDTNGTQVYGKAYPSLRELEVLKGVGDNAVVASICAKNAAPMGNAASDLSYGYNPAMSAIMERLKGAFMAKCLPQPLAVVPGDPPTLACQVFEAKLASDATGVCDCSAPGRSDAPETTRAAAADYLRQVGACGGSFGPCAAVCVCELAQLSGDELTSCLAGDADTGQSYGFCYVDPEQGAGSDATVAGCKASDKRVLRLMGDGVPAPNAYAFLSCSNAQ